MHIYLEENKRITETYHQKSEKRTVKNITRTLRARHYIMVESPACGKIALPLERVPRRVAFDSSNVPTGDTETSAEAASGRRRKATCSAKKEVRRSPRSNSTPRQPPGSRVREE
jgi:hypothetical protein